MRSDQLDREIDEIELGLLHDHADLAKQFKQLDRAEKLHRHEIAVVVLLASSAVLLVAGLAVLSAFAWFTGAALYVAAFAVGSRRDRIRQRSLAIRSDRYGVRNRPIVDPARATPNPHTFRRGSR